MREIILYKNIELPPRDEIEELYPRTERVELEETAYFHHFVTTIDSTPHEGRVYESPHVSAVIEYKDGTLDIIDMPFFKFKHPIGEVEAE